MDAKKVEILLEAVENGSMMGIAGQNGYTPSGLSHLLRRLEAELGVQLVERTNRGIALSENGKRLLRQLLLLLPAWIVLALGIAMSVFSGVGSDTNTSFQQGLGRMLGLQTGTVTLIFNCTVLAIFIFANRSLVGLGSLVIGFGLGPLLNLYLDLLGKIFRPCRRCGHASPFAPSVL